MPLETSPTRITAELHVLLVATYFSEGLDDRSPSLVEVLAVASAESEVPSETEMIPREVIFVLFGQVDLRNERLLQGIMRVNFRILQNNHVR